MKSVLHIVPGVPPAIDAVGQYAWGIAESLLETSAVGSVFWAYKMPSEVDEKFSVSSFERGVSNLPDIDAIALHYVGYGYDTNGAPTWLPHTLARLKASRPEIVLATIFHELYAIVAMPWKRAFWYSGRQRRIARALFLQSDCCLCSVPSTERILRAWGHSGRIHRLAIPSAIGEPDRITPWRDRSNVAVIFGQAHVRRGVYEELSLLSQVCRKHGIAKIIDIGPRLANSPKLRGVEIAEVGIQPASAIRRYLSTSKIALLAYPPKYLDKSSVFAAYAAHGIAPILFANAADESRRGDYLTGEEALDCSAEYIQQVADTAASAYRSHSVARHAEWLAAFCHLTDNMAIAGPTGGPF